MEEEPAWAALLRAGRHRQYAQRPRRALPEAEGDSSSAGAARRGADLEDAWHVVGSALPLPAVAQWLTQTAQAVGWSEWGRVNHAPARTLREA
eukprot:8483137-Alexandrium_andersonii.AAC.1